MINGHSAQLQRVQNLFHSVQLNVNNPHFLIMQGRITKVLNMRPIEILGMIEEAAGTRMFETRKRKAVETIEKKENKLIEINRVLEDDITPRLDKLSAQRAQSVHAGIELAANPLAGHRSSREPTVASSLLIALLSRPPRSCTSGAQIPRVLVSHD
jgi:hypothetical protein